MEDQKEFGYYAVIPVYVLQNKNLIPNAKLLYGQISALTNKQGFCWAGNEKLSESIGVSKNSINKLMKDLEKEKLITRDTKVKNNGSVRKIYLADKPNSLSPTSQIAFSDKPNSLLEIKEEKTKEKNIYIEKTNFIYEVYKEKINSSSRLTDKAKRKIKERLKNYTLEELIGSMNNFAKSAWWMEHNSNRGVAWFFNSDDRIDQFLNIKQTKEEFEKQWI